MNNLVNFMESTEVMRVIGTDYICYEKMVKN